jgi:hypothetical protein
MKRFLIILTILLITTAMILTACSNQNSTDAAIAEITKVAQTVQFQLTESSKLTPSATPTVQATATPIPATDTPTGPSLTPTETAYPTLGTGLVSGDSSLFVADVNYPDGTVFTPGTQFTKTWLFTNNGSTTWNTNYKLVYAGGSVTDRANKLFVNLTKEVKPGESVEISVDFTAPSTNGSYNSMWNLYSADGKFFGEYCSITFSVGATAATVAVTPYATVTP